MRGRKKRFGLLQKHMHVQYHFIIHYQAALEAQIRQRLELQQAHHDYQELKERKMQAMKEEEEEFRQQVREHEGQTRDTQACYVHV